MKTEEQIKELEIAFEPAPDAVCVVYIEKGETTQSGIILAPAQQNKFPARGVVVAVGGIAADNYKVGDTIIYNSYLEEGIYIEGTLCDVVTTHTILGKYK